MKAIVVELATALLFYAIRCSDADGNYRGHFTHGHGALFSLASADGGTDLDSVWLVVLRRDLELAILASHGIARRSGPGPFPFRLEGNDIAEATATNQRRRDLFRSSAAEPRDRTISILLTGAPRKVRLAKSNEAFGWMYEPGPGDLENSLTQPCIESEGLLLPASACLGPLSAGSGKSTEQLFYRPGSCSEFASISPCDWCACSCDRPEVGAGMAATFVLQDIVVWPATGLMLLVGSDVLLNADRSQQLVSFASATALETVPKIFNIMRGCSVEWFTFFLSVLPRLVRVLPELLADPSAYVLLPRPKRHPTDGDDFAVEIAKLLGLEPEQVLEPDPGTLYRAQAVVWPAYANAQHYDYVPVNELLNMRAVVLDAVMQLDSEDGGAERRESLDESCVHFVAH